MAIEEKNHAALLKSLDEFVSQLSEIPKRISKISLIDLEELNSRLEKLIPQCNDTPPSREEAFRIAYSLETSAGESHFQEFADDGSGSKIAKIFRQLNQSDVDHALRIKDYMETHGISF